MCGEPDHHTLSHVVAPMDATRFATPDGERTGGWMSLWISLPNGCHTPRQRQRRTVWMGVGLDGLTALAYPSIGAKSLRERNSWPRAKLLADHAVCRSLSIVLVGSCWTRLNQGNEQKGKYSRSYSPRHVRRISATTATMGRKLPLPAHHYLPRVMATAD